MLFLHFQAFRPVAFPGPAGPGPPGDSPRGGQLTASPRAPSDAAEVPGPGGRCLALFSRTRTRRPAPRGLEVIDAGSLPSQGGMGFRPTHRTPQPDQPRGVGR